MAIQLEIFAHFCSKFVDIRSGWSELSILVGKGKSHKIFERVHVGLVLDTILNLGSEFVLYNKFVILSGIEAFDLTAAGVEARIISSGTWLSLLFRFLRENLTLRKAIIVS